MIICVHESRLWGMVIIYGTKGRHNIVHRLGGEAVLYARLIDLSRGVSSKLVPQHSALMLCIEISPFAMCSYVYLVTIL